MALHFSRATNAPRNRKSTSRTRGRLAQGHAFGLVRQRPGFHSREGVWVGVSVSTMGRLAVPLEQGENSSALILTDMVLNPQPTNQPRQERNS